MRLLLIGLLISLPTLSFATPTLKIKSELLPLLHALVSGKNLVLITKVTYKIQWANPTQKNSMMTQVSHVFDESGLPYESMSQAQLDLFFKAAHALLTNTTDGVDMDATFNLVHTYKPEFERENFEETFDELRGIVQNMLSLLDEDTLMAIDGLTKTLSFSDFTTFKRVGYNKLNQRYRITAYDPTIQAPRFIDFFLVEQKKKPLLKIIKPIKPKKKSDFPWD